MPIKKNIVCLTFVFAFLFVLPSSLFGGGQEDPAVRAIQLFNAGNYREAEQAFRALLEKDGGNPMVQYYYGASRTENGHYEDAELELLLRSGKTFTANRLHYYLGIQYHARNQWEQALRNYNQFRSSVPVAEQLELELPLKIQQCYDRVNPFRDIAVTVEHPPAAGIDSDLLSGGSVATTRTPDSVFRAGETLPSTVKIEGETASADAAPEGASTAPISSGSLRDEAVDSTTDRRAEQSIIIVEYPAQMSGDARVTIPYEQPLLPDLPGVEVTHPLPAGSRISFRVNDRVTYLFSSQFRTGEGMELFTEGAAKEEELQKVREKMEQLRRAYRSVGAEERVALGEQILALEQDAYTLQDDVNSLYAEARNRESSWWLGAGDITLQNFLVEQEKIRDVLSGGTVAEEPAERRSSQPTEISPELLSGRYEAPADNSRSATQEQLIYKIQIGAYSRGVPAYRQRIFDKLAVIRTIERYTDEEGVVVYTTGNLSSLEDAQKMQAQVQQEGIKDAKIVPYFKGKRITLEQAKKIEAGDEL